MQFVTFVAKSLDRKSLSLMSIAETVGQWDNDTLGHQLIQDEKSGIELVVVLVLSQFFSKLEGCLPIKSFLINNVQYCNLKKNLKCIVTVDPVEVTDGYCWKVNFRL